LYNYYSQWETWHIIS